MKTSVALGLAFLTVLPTFGQYSARRLTRRIAPQTQPAARPAAPAKQAPAQAAPAPTPTPQSVYHAPAVAAVPATPADPQKVAAQKSKSERDLLEWQKKRAEGGSDNAQYELGMRYLTGNGVDQDEKVGKEWIEKAAKNGNAKAAKKLEDMKSETASPAEAVSAATVNPSK
jgi:TPR repeat protein